MDLIPEGTEVVIIGLDLPFTVDHYNKATNEYQLFLPGQNRTNGKPYALVFAKAEVVRPNTTLWCQHLGLIAKETIVRPASQTRQYTDIHKAKIEENRNAGITEELDREIKMTIDLASGQGQYTCVHTAMNPAQAELIALFMRGHGYSCTVMGSDVQISW